MAVDKIQNASPVKGAAVPTEDNELDLIGGTNEDDFTDAMQNIRERELLYGHNSLLTNFGPMVSEICANNVMYKVCSTLGSSINFAKQVRTWIYRRAQPCVWQSLCVYHVRTSLVAAQKLG